MKGEFLFLGTGGSTGIPMMACHCPVCLSSDPLNKRLRPSALLTWNNKTFLIDTGPDLRTQALKYDIDHLDGVLLTHSHYDHIAGIDELRSYYVMNHTVLPVLVSKTTFEELKIRYYYFFQEKKEGKTFAAQLNFSVLENERGKMEFATLPLQYMTYEQGGMKVTGFRFGDLAYVSDIKHYPETIFQDLEGLQTLIISSLREAVSPLHFSIEEAVAFAKKVKAKNTYFTHMSHEVEHKTINEKLPDHISLAYDGLKLEFSHVG